MTTEVLGLDDLASGQSQPEVPINRTSRRLEASIAGTKTIEVSANTDVTIPTSGEPAPWRYSTIRIHDGGSVLTGPVDVIFPDLAALDFDATPRFELINDTAVTLTIVAGGTGAVAVGAGESALVRYDGENIVPVAASSTPGSGTADLGFYFPGGPPTSSQLLYKYVTPRAFTIPDDFAGARGHVGTNPTGSFVMTVSVAGSSVGTITVSTGGAFTFATTGGSVAVSAGERIEIAAPSGTDATVADIAVTMQVTL